ncbi:MAG TPA: ACT domain-containing protein [Candidatus Hydrogenedentes bacterium]|nr:ACT domain-containing protein [Candidatus Hydrogenedentota bacterium]HPG69912.1 ACT domain-containing protein [Candidatus Hydrogenedentota bacterium]
MNVKQLSLFLENKPAHLKVPCQVLAKEGINILTLSLADTDQFGILRIIVNDWQRAVDALEKTGHVVKVTDVLAVEVEDRPGGLVDLLEIIDEANLNIDYMYAFTFGQANRATMVFRFRDPDSAIRALEAKGVNVLNTVALADRTVH